MSGHQIIRKLQRKYGVSALIVALILDVGLLWMGWDAAGHGILLGSAFSVLNFFVLGNRLPRQLVTDRKRATAISMFYLYGRYLLMAIPLVIAMKSPIFDFAATACGLFMVQGCILAEPLVRPSGHPQAPP